MRKLKELERRLRDEPENLGLRVMVAGTLYEAGRRDEAIALYRSVAVAYRAQGRPQQAITVCRRILELAPEDLPCRELLAALVASQPVVLDSPPPGRPPPPLPYHVADPTSPKPFLRPALPPSLRAELESYPEIASIANAARQISDALIAASRRDGADDDDGGDGGDDSVERRG